MKPPWSHARVVKASGRLSPLEKLTWLEHYGLMKGSHGARVSASAVGRRISCGRATVERARDLFLRIGLMSKQSLGSGRCAEWFAVLPVACRFPATRIDDDTCERLAEQLDAHITSLIGDGGCRSDSRAEDQPPSLDDGAL